MTEQPVNRPSYVTCIARHETHVCDEVQSLLLEYVNASLCGRRTWYAVVDLLKKRIIVIAHNDRPRLAYSKYPYTFSLPASVRNTFFLVNNEVVVKKLENTVVPRC